MSHSSRRDFLKAASLAGFGLAFPTGRSRVFMFGQSTPGPMTGKFQATADSLSQYAVPDWYRDAKFGIFLHWGVYSVPAHSSEWYPRLMYQRQDPVFKWHQEHWGPQNMFGYKDFIPMFTAEKWDPDAWAELFRKAGAKYVVPVAEHHDGFPMYDSHLTEWCAGKMGPRRNVVGELGRAVRNQGMKLGTSSHRAFHWSYYTFEPDFDTSNPLYATLYGPIHAPTPLVDKGKGAIVQTPSTEFIEDWFARCVEIVNLFEPDFFYFDWANFPPGYLPYRYQFAAYYYNLAAAADRGAVITYKGNVYPEHAAVLDIERGLLGDIRELPWQTDTSIGWKSWGYIADEEYKPAEEIIREFADIVSKNGCLLLNVGPRHDGTIPDEAKKTLLDIGRWLDVNGEAIYASRPWKTYGEGPTKLAAGSFAEKRMKGFTAEDVRFTQKSSAVYAIAMGWADRQFTIKSLGSAAATSPGKISRVELLGSDEELTWKQQADALVIQTPKQKPCDIAYVFKVNS